VEHPPISFQNALSWWIPSAYMAESFCQAILPNDKNFLWDGSSMDEKPGVGQAKNRTIV
jgi:hypothetical protein